MQNDSCLKRDVTVFFLSRNCVCLLLRVGRAGGRQCSRASGGVLVFLRTCTVGLGSFQAGCC